MKRCGIYLITHTATGRAYVGQSIDIDSRLRNHAKGKEPFHIGCAIAFHGWQAFTNEVLELCERDALNAAEQRWIAKLGTTSPAGFNLTTGGGQAFTFTEDVRRRMSEGSKVWLTPELIRRRADKLRGVPKSAEHRAKMSAAAKANKANLERFAALSSNQSAETRAKISAAKIGKKPMTEAGRARLAQAKRSPENLARLAHMVRNFSPETKAKMSASAKARDMNTPRCPQTGRIISGSPL